MAKDFQKWLELNRYEIEQALIAAGVSFVANLSGLDIRELTLNDSWQYMNHKSCGYCGQINNINFGFPFLHLTFNDFKETHTFKDSKEIINSLYENRNAATPTYKKRNMIDLKKQHEKQQVELRNKQQDFANSTQTWEILEKQGSHPYLETKRIKEFIKETGIRFGEDDFGEFIAVPLTHSVYQNFCGYQRIYNKAKILAPGTTLKDANFIFGKIDSACKEIYIAEGFSTCATIYQATSTPTIMAVSSTNIKNVAQNYRMLYPWIKIVFACDKDHYPNKKGKILNTGFKKSNEAALAVGGKLTLPDFSALHTKKRTDFNDLFLETSLEETEHQLNCRIAPVLITDQKVLKIHTKKHKTIKFNSRYMDYKLVEQGKVNLVCSPTGSGKTTAFNSLNAELCKENPHVRILAITPSRALTGQVAHKTNSSDYRDFKGNFEGRSMIRFDPQLAICINSIPKLEGAEAYELVMIDEIDEILHQINNGGHITKEERILIFENLKRIIKTASTVLVCDANLSNTTLAFLEEIRIGENYNILFNEYNTHKDILDIIFHKEDAVKQVLDSLKADENLFITSNNKEWCEQLKLIISLQFPTLVKEILLITADNLKDSVVQTFLKNPDLYIEENQPRVIMASPTLSSGFSIDDPYFHKTIGFFFNNSNLPSDWHQSLHRVRKTDKRIAFIQQSRQSLPTKKENIISSWQAALNTEEKSLLTSLNIDTGIRTVKDPSYLNLWADCTVARNKQKNNPKGFYCAYSESEGHTLSLISNRISEEDQEIIKMIIKTARDMRKQDYSDTILNAHNLVQAEIDRIKQRIRKTGAELASVRKFKIAKFNGVTPQDLTEEMIKDYEKGRLASKIKKAYNFSLSKEQALQRSRLDRERKIFEQDLTFFVLLSSLAQNFLQFFGISVEENQFVFNEKVSYSAKTLQEKVIPFLIENKQLINGTPSFPIKLPDNLFSSRKSKMKITQLCGQFFKSMGMQTTSKLSPRDEKTKKRFRIYSIKESSVEQLNSLISTNFLTEVDHPLEDAKSEKEENTVNTVNADPEVDHPFLEFIKKKILKKCDPLSFYREKLFKLTSINPKVSFSELLENVGAIVDASCGEARIKWDNFYSSFYSYINKNNMWTSKFVFASKTNTNGAC